MHVRFSVPNDTNKWSTFVELFQGNVGNVHGLIALSDLSRAMAEYRSRVSLLVSETHSGVELNNPFKSLDCFQLKVYKVSVLL